MGCRASLCDASSEANDSLNLLECVVVLDDLRHHLLQLQDELPHVLRDGAAEAARLRASLQKIRILIGNGARRLGSPRTSNLFQVSAKVLGGLIRTLDLAGQGLQVLTLLKADAAAVLHHPPDLLQLAVPLFAHDVLQVHALLVLTVQFRAHPCDAYFVLFEPRTPAVVAVRLSVQPLHLVGEVEHPRLHMPDPLVGGFVGSPAQGSYGARHEHLQVSLASSQGLQAVVELRPSLPHLLGSK
mmetsp:Transcript_11256/g.22877  ORF Transcript_11256/g.22877 Transcript_11256/m.22877 type:complete len:242 (-) Transcript_11256:646-1371(-)